MADLNEPKKETDRSCLITACAREKDARVNPPDRPPGPPAGVKPPATDVRPAASVAANADAPLTPPLARPPRPTAVPPADAPVLDGFEAPRHPP